MDTYGGFYKVNLIDKIQPKNLIKATIFEWLIWLLKYATKNLTEDTALMMAFI